MPVKLRELPNIEGMSPEIQEMFRWNHWVIENALNSVGAVSPVVSSESPSSPFFDNFLYLPGKVTGQQLRQLATENSFSIVDPQGTFLYFNSSYNPIGHRDFIIGIENEAAPKRLVLINNAVSNPGATGSSIWIDSDSDIGFESGLSVGTFNFYDPSGVGLGISTYAAVDLFSGRNLFISSAVALTLCKYPGNTGNIQTNILGRLRVGINTLNQTNALYIDAHSISTADHVLVMIKSGSAATGDFLRIYDQTGGGTPLARIDSGGTWLGPIQTGPSIPSNFYDNSFNLIDDIDNTKIFKFELAGISSATTRIWNVPDSNDTFLGLSTAQNPLNKTFNNTNIFTIRDDRFTLQDNGDTTKQLVLQLSSITTGTTRTLTIQDINGTIAVLEAAETWSGIQTFGAAVVFNNDSTVNGDMTFTTSLITVDITTGAQFTVKTPNGGADVLGYYFDGAGNDYTLQIGGIYANATLIFPSAGGTVVTTTAAQALSAKSINGGSDTRTGRTSSLGTTNISVSPTTAAVYEVLVIIEVTAAGGADRTVEATVGWTDNVGATTQQVIAPFAANATGRTSGVVRFRRASGNITIASALAGVAGGAPTWNVYTRCLNAG